MRLSTIKIIFLVRWASSRVTPATLHGRVRVFVFLPRAVNFLDDRCVVFHCVLGDSVGFLEILLDLACLRSRTCDKDGVLQGST